MRSVFLINLSLCRFSSSNTSSAFLQLSQRAREIYNSFLSSKATTPVNIDSQAQLADDILNAPRPDMFKEQQLQVAERCSLLGSGARMTPLPRRPRSVPIKRCRPARTCDSEVTSVALGQLGVPSCLFSGSSSERARQQSRPRKKRRQQMFIRACLPASETCSFP